MKIVLILIFIFCIVLPMHVKGAAHSIRQNKRWLRSQQKFKSVQHYKKLKTTKTINGQDKQQAGTMKCSYRSVDCSPTWIHDWHFYWPYHYYGYHHPYYWHDGFHLTFGC